MTRARHRDQAAAVQRLQVRYAKRGRMRFTSHRDFQRAFERALRRAEVPMAYSQGYSPHPKVSYFGAAPMGAASEAEYLEISLTRACDPADVARSLDAALPAGLDVVEVVEAAGDSLADRLQASVWRIEMPAAEPTSLAAAVAKFLAAGSVEVRRVTKNGSRMLDARAAVVRLEVDIDRDTEVPVLLAAIRHLTPTVRPDDLVTALGRFEAGPPGQPYVSTRLTQGPVDEATVGDPGHDGA
ncbi:MAG TPA: TIGR03936 family radical SAM-associated protein [Jiangellaceae bacterium]|nr:TIGR03936 family radical SAM-associated protein [Jiangellaceae bacterium]